MRNGSMLDVRAIMERRRRLFSNSERVGDAGRGEAEAEGERHGERAEVVVER